MVNPVNLPCPSMPKCFQSHGLANLSFIPSTLRWCYILLVPVLPAWTLLSWLQDLTIPQSLTPNPIFRGLQHSSTPKQWSSSGACAALASWSRYEPISNMTTCPLFSWHFHPCVPFIPNNWPELGVGAFFPLHATYHAQGWYRAQVARVEQLLREKSLSQLHVGSDTRRGGVDGKSWRVDLLNILTYSYQDPPRGALSGSL